MRSSAVLGTLLLSLAACNAARTSSIADLPPPDASVPRRDDPFLDTLQQRTFGYFWELSDPRTRLVPDRWPTPSFSSVAAVGFALTSYPIGVERKLVTRREAAQRTVETLRFLWRAPQGPGATGMAGYRGLFYHFLDMGTGERFKDVELSTIDTSLLLAGVLTCGEYFDGPGADEAEIRALADSLYLRADWKWMQVRPPLLGMGWKPESGFIDYDWHGLNEGMLLYVMALGSPTHPIEPDAWTAWASTYKWGTYYGQEHLSFAPLFGHQYSQVWIDFRGIRDPFMREKGIDYFENSRRATLAQREYAIANPDGWKGYGADLWGLSASDGPVDGDYDVHGRRRHFFTYAARGASFTEVRDDGTLAPTAAGGSIAFAPEVAIPAMKEMRRRYGDDLFGRYGFLDAFNPTFDLAVPVHHGRVVPGVGWFDTDYLGIDQGPIIAMTENYRSGLVWKLMRKNPHIARGLRRAGFTGGWLDAPGAPK
ncbi:MAG TPA: glucoamylase family protein [Longimicrobiaceae bacterium]|jgi:hypothetical protein|nr:glucoamylase family protein [Longimicrobiaceae bacterium]